MGKGLSVARNFNSNDLDGLENVQRFKPSKSDVENRFQSRTDVRNNEGISCKVKILVDGNPIDQYFDVFDISSFGICIKVEKTLSSFAKLKAAVALTIEFNGEFKFTTTGEVRWTASDDIDSEKIKVGIQYLYSESRDSWNPNEAEIHDRFPLIGYVYKPVVYSERSVVVISSISTTTMKLKLLGADFLLFPEMELKIRIAVQSNANSEIKVKVKSVERLASGQILVYAQIVKISKSFTDNLVDFFLQSSEVSPAKLKMAGFKPKNVSNNFRFRYVKTHEDYLEVLKLRFQAYKDAGKVLDATKISDMATPFDHRSRILVAYHGEILVASCMISFPKSDDVLESEGFLPNGYDFELPARDNLLEVARLCTLADYRGADVLKRMFEHIYKLMVTCGREYIITSCDERLWPLYDKLGFKKTGQFYLHKKLNDKRHDIIMVHRDTGIKSKMGNLLVWYYLYGNMTDFMLSKRTASTNRMTKIKLLILNSAVKTYNFVFRK